MSRLSDISGERFGRLVAVNRVSTATRKGGKHIDTIWLCRCDCGADKQVGLTNLTSGRTKSCGCLRFVQGGLSRKHPLWKRWQQMLERCSNPNHNRYASYGGRGIKVCDRWKSFPLFLEDVERSYKAGKTIDRVNNDGDYEPSNFQWASLSQQARNKQKTPVIDTKWGKITVAEASQKCGLSPQCIRYRIKAGWPQHRLLEPIHS